jgi:hypothetical protein
MTERETPSAMAQLAATMRALQHQPSPSMTRLVSGMRQAIAAFTPVAEAQARAARRIAASVRVEATEDTPH